jgi:hypothetical protein
VKMEKIQKLLHCIKVIAIIALYFYYLKNKCCIMNFINYKNAIVYYFCHLKYKYMKKALFVLVISVSIIINAFSQKPLVKVETITACKGDTVLVPVNLINFNNVCAIGIRVSYDPGVLKYVKLVNVNKQMPGADFAGIMDKTSNKGIITLGWFSTNTTIIANIASGKVFDIKFVYLKEESTNLELMESGTMASDCGLNNMSLDFTSGKIQPKKSCK